MGKTRRLKKIVRELLETDDIDTLMAKVKEEPRVVSALLSFTYDKDNPLTWKAIKAIGPLVKSLAEESPEAASEIGKRLLWSVTEESGGLGWSAIEMLSELVCYSPRLFAHYASLMPSFFEEPIFRPGVLYALRTVATCHPEYIDSWDLIRALIEEALQSDDPETIVQALLLYKAVKDRIAPLSINERLGSDQRTVKVFIDGRLVEKRLSDVYKEVIG